jgi:VTC domain-containing protein
MRVLTNAPHEMPSWPAHLRSPGRIEIKYAVCEAVAAWVWCSSRTFIRPDHRFNGPQRVTSLYFDAPSLTFLRWHKERRPGRFKLRVRGYGDPVGEHVYAEIKRKTGAIVQKHRARFPLADLPALFNSSAPFVELDGSAELAEFMKIRQAFHAEPRMLVSCLRESLREDGPVGEVAVTVDRQLVCQQAHHFDLAGDPRAWQAVTLPRVVGSETALVELKYTEDPPAWMKSLILELAAYRVSFSKYRASMEHCPVR